MSEARLLCGEEVHHRAASDLAHEDSFSLRDCLQRRESLVIQVHGHTGGLGTSSGPCHAVCLVQHKTAGNCFRRYVATKLWMVSRPALCLALVLMPSGLAVSRRGRVGRVAPCLVEIRRDGLTRCLCTRGLG